MQANNGEYHISISTFLHVQIVWHIDFRLHTEGKETVNVSQLVLFWSIRKRDYYNMCFCMITISIDILLLKSIFEENFNRTWHTQDVRRRRTTGSMSGNELGLSEKVSAVNGTPPPIMQILTEKIPAKSWAAAY